MRLREILEQYHSAPANKDLEQQIKKHFIGLLPKKYTDEEVIKSPYEISMTMIEHNIIIDEIKKRISE